MNLYELERKINEKAEKWELFNLQNQNRELKSRIDELEAKMQRVYDSKNQMSNIFREFLNIILEHPQFSDFQDEIYRIKNNF